MMDLINDILFGAVLQPVFDLVANPDSTANPLIELAFHPGPTKLFPPASGRNVEILNSFLNSHASPVKSALHMDLSAILKNQSSLYAFMNFLKEENAINQLQFCLSVGK